MTHFQTCLMVCTEGVLSNCTSVPAPFLSSLQLGQVDFPCCCPKPTLLQDPIFSYLLYHINTAILLFIIINFTFLPNSFCHQSLAIISNPLLRFPMCQILSVLPIYLFILSFNPLSPALSPLHGFLRWALLLFSVFMRG